jgi:hypothetical protein
MRLRCVAGCSNAGQGRVTEPDRRPASGARTEDAATLAPRWASQRAPPLQRKRTTYGRRSRLAIGPWRPTRPFPARDYVREHDAHRTRSLASSSPSCGTCPFARFGLAAKHWNASPAPIKPN